MSAHMLTSGPRRPGGAARPGQAGRQRRCPRGRLHAVASAAALPRVPDLNMKRHKLGASDLEVTEACLGTMTWGEQNSEAEAHAQLSFAVNDCGVNMVDTSEIYPVAPRRETGGATSRILGAWLAGQRRERLVVASKVAGRSSGLQWVPANRTDPPGPEAPPVLDGPAIRAACEGELRRLRTDYLDLLQLHWPDRYVPLFGQSQYRREQERPATPVEEQVEAMGQLIREGKVRHWGLSNETATGVALMCAAADRLGVPRPVTIQNSFSLVHRSFESELAEAASPANWNLGLLPWSALGGGVLTGKYLPPGAAAPAYPPGSRFALFADRYARFHSPRVLAAAAEYAALAARLGLTPAQLGYAFCRSRPFIPSVIVGATSLAQLAENLGAFTAAGELGAGALAEIDGLHVRTRNPALLD